MNKKFSTLMAGILLATAFGTASAQSIPSSLGNFAKYATVPAEEVIDMEKGYVQLAVADPSTDGKVLSMEATASGKYNLVVKTINSTPKAEIRNTLWKVVATEVGISGYTYQFQNVGTGEFLGFNTDEAVKATDAAAPSVTLTAAGTTVGSEIVSWTWQATPAKEIAAPGAAQTYFTDADLKGLTAVFSKDSTLALGCTTLADGSVVSAYKYSNKKAAATGATAITFYPVAPAEFILGADDLNSMLWTQNPQAESSKLKLVFNPDVTGNSYDNLFTKNSYKAVAAVGFPAANATGANPFSGATAMTSLYAAEKAYQEAVSKKQWIDALLGAALTDGVVDAGKVTKITDAMTVLTAGTDFSTLTITKKSDLVKYLDGTTAGVTWPETSEAAVVKAQAIDYVKKFQGTLNTAALAESTMDAIAGSLFTFYSVNFTTGATKAGIEAKIKEEYVDKATTGTVATRAQVTTDSTTVRNTATIGFNAVAASNGWVSLLSEEDADDAKNNTYLAVDQNFITTAGGRRDLGFAIKKFEDAGYTENTNARLDLNGRYNFQFTYFPNADSIVIRTAGWAKKLDTQASWKDMDATNTDLAADQTSAGNNLVKLTYLTNTHSEITLGLEEKNGKPTINTRIALTPSADQYVKTTLASGVYYLSLVSEKAANKNINGKNLIANIAGKGLIWANEETSKVFEGTVQNYANMPRAQWVVEQNLGAAGQQTVNIYNREFPTYKAERVQLYKAGDGQVFAAAFGGNLTLTNDTLAVVAATGVDNETLGYKALPYDNLTENVFSLKYFNGLNAGNFVEVKAAENEAMYVNPAAENGMQFVFVPTLKDKAPEKNKYGYEGDAAKQLTRIAYKIQVYEPAKKDADKLYVKADGTGYILAKGAANGTEFFIKENNELKAQSEMRAEGEAVSYYALVEKTLNKAAGVKHPSLMLSREDLTSSTTDLDNSVAAFAFIDGTNGLYRRLGKSVADDFEDNKPDTAVFYMSLEPTRFLYENTANRTAANGNKVAKDSLNFLGVINIADLPETSALPIYVDTAYVRNNTSMPQYMLALGVETVGDTEAVPCPLDHNHGVGADGKPLTADQCSHATPATKGYKAGRYLVALADSAAEAPIKYQNNFRLAFVPAKHMADTLIIDNSKYTGTKNAAKDSIQLANDKALSVATFAFRIAAGSENGDFVIEAVKNADGEPQYIRVHNGVPVLVKAIEDAAIFNVEKTSKNPTANEAIEATGVQVIGGKGAVTVQGAAGKVITVAKVLGQTIANQVAASDNVTIAAPAGIVVVAVEGDATKVVVK